MSRQREPTNYWKAHVTLETISPLGFSAVIDEYKDPELGKKVKEVRIEHFSNDGNVIFDVGKRLKGWLRQSLATVRGETSVVVKRSQHGLWCKSLPTVGFVEIGGLSELVGLKRPDGVTRDLKLPEGLETYPFHDYGLADGGKRSFTAYFYHLPPPRTLQAEVVSFVKGIDHKFIQKKILKLIGQHAGIGDRHSQAGMGLFELKTWELKEEMEIA